jgi:hypothetical protein
MTNRQIDRKAQELSNIFLKCERDIIRYILSGERYTLAEQEAIMARIIYRVDKSQTQADAWAERTTKDVYIQGAKIIAGLLAVKWIYSTQDQQAIQALTTSTQTSLHEVFSGFVRSSSNMLSGATQQRIQTLIAEGRLNQQHITDITKTLANDLRKGAIVLRDKAGRNWTAKNYSDMYARTDIMKGYNQGAINQMLEHDEDLMRITRSSEPCEFCIPWENKIVSISGRSRKYPSIQDAENEGVWHPRCQHRLVPV